MMPIVKKFGVLIFGVTTAIAMLVVTYLDKFPEDPRVFSTVIAAWLILVIALDAYAKKT